MSLYEEIKEYVSLAGIDYDSDILNESEQNNIITFYRGIPTGSDPNKISPNTIIWVTDDPEYASVYGSVYELLVDITNYASEENLEDAYSEIYDDPYSSSAAYMDMIEDKEVQQLLKEQNFDIVECGESGDGSSMYVILNPACIKSTKKFKF